MSAADPPPDTDDTVESIDGPLAGRPAPDKLARAVAQARIASALFAKSEPVKLGRYHLLERVGAGGMGVVWGAWDPELDRRVAIKLLHAATSETRERLLAEGQALAKLAHPNVVAVHDVGVVEDQVYLVMEWVRGHNLRVHCREPRSVREIVSLMRSAGEGLVAAHEAGMIHRDFKPENVMVGDDGRVRVLDFGIALAHGDEPDRVAGTPKYMAPEQARIDAATPAVDQFAFCVVLDELLRARAVDRPATVPAWLSAIITRGTAEDPSARFTSMRDLLRELARDPATVRRRRVLVAAALAAVAVAFVAGTTRAGDGLEPCAGGREEVARVWGPEARARLVAHTRTLGPYAQAEAQRIDSLLAEYGERWVGAQRRVCLAHRRGEVTPRLYERGLACITRARAAFATVIDVLARASVETYPNAVSAARALPNAERCMIDAVDSSVVPPDRTIANVVGALGADATRARYRALASDPDAVTFAARVAAASDDLGYEPLIARAQLSLGMALANDSAQYPQAVTAYAKSAGAALAASDDVLFVEAFARELFTASRVGAKTPSQRVRELSASVPLVEIIAKRAGDAGLFARALFFNNAGTERLAAGDIAMAEKWFRRAHEQLRGGIPDNELLVVLGNLAMVLDSRIERDKLFAAERAGFEQALGPTHATTLLVRYRAATYIENPLDAARELAEVCAAISHWHPHQRDRIARCNYELGWVQDELGGRAASRAAFEATATTGYAQEAAVARTRVIESPAEAERAALQVAADATGSDTWFRRFPAGVDAWHVVAEARVALGKHIAAIEAEREALTILADPRLNQRAPRYLRRLARTRGALARLLAARDPKLARELANHAIEWWRAAGGYDEPIRSLEAAGSGSR